MCPIPSSPSGKKQKKGAIYQEGALPAQELRKLINKKEIIKVPEGVDYKDNIQPASIDLTLGSKAYRLQSSFLPQAQTVESRINDLLMYEIDLDKGGILERGAVYLIPLQEELDLSKDRSLKGKANPKSSTGRLDVFTRLITDYCHRFDDVVQGYCGKLYLEVVPLSFTIKVKTGQTLNQIRLFKLPLDKRQANLILVESGEDQGRLFSKGDELSQLFLKEELLLDDDRKRIDNIKKHIADDGLLMSVDILGEKDGIVGYKAKKNSQVIDLEKVGYYSSDDFWEPLKPHKNHLILEPEEFYIFASKEFIRVPINYCAEMVEYDAGSGELRTHYAGFFDPGFGYGKEGEIKGTKAVLEVRPHDVPFRIEDGQILFKMRYEKMAGVPNISYGEELKSNYHNQKLKLSKLFKQ